ncbi:MAG: efflux transporter outer membrane subunit [Flavobacteriaceae bacterium]|nr:efflux transporter outer membrane subunit [Flavobacteriaceae bacterium]
MKKLLIYGLVFTQLLLLKSCFVAKDYERDETFEPDEKLFRTDEVEKQKDTTSVAELSWREVFTDTLLQSHIDEALTNNLDIRLALQQIMIADAMFKEGKAGFLPEVNFSGNVNYQNLAPNSQFGNFFNSITQYEAPVNLSWEADVWGKIRSNKRATQAAYLQSVAGHQAIKTELIAQIASLYYQIASLDEQIKITEKTIATRKKSLATTEALKSSGRLTKVAVKQTEAQVYTAEALLFDLKNELRFAENALSVLKAKEPHRPERNSLQEQSIGQQIEIGVPAQLLRNRPDVVAAEYELINAFELTNVARASLYPSFTLNASAGLQSLTFGDFFSANSFFYNALGGFTQPVFNRRALKTQLEVAEGQKEQAALQFQQTLLTAGQEVSDAMYSLSMLQERLLIKEKECKAYQEAFEYSEDLLKNGLADYLEVLNAQENVLNTELDVVENKRQVLQSNIELYRALGGGWQ